MRTCYLPIAAVILTTSLLAGCRVDTKGIGAEAGTGDGSSRSDRPDAGVEDAPGDGPADGVPASDEGGPGPPGSACLYGSECTTGVCTEGICCESTCTGDCEACNVVGSVGTCVALKGAPRPGRTGCVGAGTPCAGACDGIDRDACRYPGGETTCMPGSCADGKAVARAVCSGTGICLPPQEVTCAPYNCDGPICAGGCSPTTPCAIGHFCNAGRCTLLGMGGEACAAGDQCATGFCVDKRCCAQKACGACESCTGAGGTCAKLTTGTDPDACGGVCTAGGCKKTLGQACGGNGECATGFCANGRCCNRACSAACESCNLPGSVGTCSAIDLTVDENNCGGCGTRCSRNHVTALCTAGKCVGACQGGFADCNGNKATDGCEIQIANDENNCGGCGTRCPGTTCQSGTCEKIEFTWSFVGPVAGKTCVLVDEPADPNFWVDNYLCTDRDFGFRFSSAGALPGLVCTAITEPSDPHTWTDNFLCAPADYGLQWSFVGPIAGMRCTLVNEPSDPNAWSDNYLCAPP